MLKNKQVTSRLTGSVLSYKSLNSIMNLRSFSNKFELQITIKTAIKMDHHLVDHFLLLTSSY